MMNKPATSFSTTDVLGRRLSVHLNQAQQALPYDITERLRAARIRAVSARRLAQFEWQTDTAIQSQGNHLLLNFPSKSSQFFSGLVSFVPLLCLVAGLVLLYDFHNDQSAVELAEVDSALLIDDLPPQAYADPAFANFLKSHRASQE